MHEPLIVWVLLIPIAGGFAVGFVRAIRDIAAGRLPAKRRPVAQIETRRPTVTRTVAGGLLAGPLGALAGFAWRKRTRENVYRGDEDA